MTAVAVIAAVAVYFSPAAIRALEFDREQIALGQAWRVFTGHWVHLDARQLGWNLAVLIPAGVWAEKIMPLRARVLYLVAPALIGSVLYFALPQLARFGGLSGVCAAVVAFLAMAQLRLAEPDRWFWRLVLALLALKIAAEAIVASRWVSHFPDPVAQAVPLAHLAGIAAGSLVLTVRRKRRPVR